MGWRVKVTFRESRLHGMGVFAVEPICSGTKVWVVDKTMKICGPAQLGALPPNELHFALHGGYLHFPSQKFVYYDDGMEYVNHADAPAANIGITGWTPLLDDNCTALRDIAPGEELLEDYTFWSVLHLHRHHWLVDLYRDFCPEHYMFLASLEERRATA